MSISLITLFSFVFLVCLVTGINTTNLSTKKQPLTTSKGKPPVRTIQRECCTSQISPAPKIPVTNVNGKQPLSSSSTSSSSSGKGSSVTQNCTCISSLEKEFHEFKQGFDNMTEKIEGFFDAIVGSRQDIAENFERIDTVLNFLLQDYVSGKNSNPKKLLLFKFIQNLTAPKLAPKRLDQERSTSEKSKTEASSESEPTANTTNINAEQEANILKPAKKSIYLTTYGTGDNLYKIFSDVSRNTNGLNSTKSFSTNTLYRSSGTLNLNSELLPDQNQEIRKPRKYSARGTTQIISDNSSSSISSTKRSTRTLVTASMGSINESSDNSGSGGSKDSILN